MFQEMKTTVTMVSEDRNLFGVIVPQDSKSRFLQINSLQDAYDSVAESKGWSVKRVADVTESQNFMERVYYILKDDNKFPESLNTGFPVFKNYCQNQGGINKVLRQLGYWKLSGKGVGRTTWCNPYIWVCIALEMNPEIFAIVVKWLTDSLIFERMNCGVKYLPLTDEIKKYLVKSPDDKLPYIRIPQAINTKVFGYHQKDIRNIATQEQLSELHDIEVSLTAMFKVGIIKSIEDCENLIQKM